MTVSKITITAAIDENVVKGENYWDSDVVLKRWENSLNLKDKESKGKEIEVNLDASDLLDNDQSVVLKPLEFDAMQSDANQEEFKSDLNLLADNPNLNSPNSSSSPIELTIDDLSDILQEEVSTEAFSNEVIENDLIKEEPIVDFTNDTRLMDALKNIEKINSN